MASTSTNTDEAGGDCESTHHDTPSSCFQKWMQLQRHDLSNLLQFLHNYRNGADSDGEVDVNHLVDTIITHYEYYISNRSHHAAEAVIPFYAPSWCTSLENSMLWITGCRPSIYIRLLYALSGCDLESRLTSGHLLGEMQSGDIRVGDLSPEQLVQVNSLHVKTMKEEGRLTSEMASFQEEVADEPIAMIANKMERIGEANENAEKALKDLQMLMKEVMEKADGLRLKTLKQLLGILKPLQAVEFLAATKKLCLAMHEWGKSEDQRQIKD